MSRWIRVQTSIFEHELFAAAELSQREAWLWLITNAAWKETRHRIGNEVLDVPVGSMFVTLRSLQSAWRWGSDKRVRTFLSMLENERMIETKTDAGKTQITVCNYSRYQDVGRTEDASRTHTGRSADALKTPVHQDTNTSSLRSDVCPEPENSAPATQSPSVIDLPATQGQTVTITEADIAEWRDAFPAVDVPQQLRAMRQWLLANERNRKTVRGMRKFVVSWLARDQDRGGARQHNGHQSQAPPRQSAFRQHQDEIYQRLKRETGDRDDQFTGTTLDIGPGDYHPH